jgi:hypothetical protein
LTGISLNKIVLVLLLIIFAKMQRSKSILLLFVTAMILFPWKLICIAHPTGHSHTHHDPGKPSACELRKLFTGKGAAYFPPMHCNHIDPGTDNFKAPEKYQITPPAATQAMAILPVDVLPFGDRRIFFIRPPEPKCRSATIIPANSLRGPPMI